jgi:hypothetical protein
MRWRTTFNPSRHCGIQPFGTQVGPRAVWASWLRKKPLPLPGFKLFLSYMLLFLLSYIESTSIVGVINPPNIAGHQNISDIPLKFHILS